MTRPHMAKLSWSFLNLRQFGTPLCLGSLETPCERGPVRSPLLYSKNFCTKADSSRADVWAGDDRKIIRMDRKHLSIVGVVVCSAKGYAVPPII